MTITLKKNLLFLEFENFDKQFILKKSILFVTVYVFIQRTSDFWVRGILIGNLVTLCMFGKSFWIALGKTCCTHKRSLLTSNSFGCRRCLRFSNFFNLQYQVITKSKNGFLLMFRKTKKVFLENHDMKNTRVCFESFRFFCEICISTRKTH